VLFSFICKFIGQEICWEDYYSRDIFRVARFPVQRLQIGGLLNCSGFVLRILNT